MARKEQAQVASPSTDLEQCRIADQAAREFHNGYYVACVQTLLQLAITEETKRRIYHNVAVADYYHSGLKADSEFLNHLESLIGDTAPNLFNEIRGQSFATILFNKAILLYHTRQTLRAWKLLRILLKCLNQFDATFVQRIGLLSIEILLNLNQPTKVKEIIDLMTKRLRLRTDSRSGSDTDDSKKPEDQVKCVVIRNLDYFQWMFRMYKIRAKVMNGTAVTIPLEEVRGVQQYTPEMLLLKAHQYYANHDYQMAAKELAKQPCAPLPAFLTNGEDYNTTIANNMGLVHFHVRHYAMAVRFFQHALTFDQTAMESAGPHPPLHAAGASRRPEILYNLGIALLHLKRPKDAFECLLVPLSIYHNNPRLWLRLAEACIMVHKENMKSKHNTHVASSIIGSGLHRKYIIQPTEPKYSADDKGSFAIPATNLEFALVCLRNALACIERYEDNITRETMDRLGGRKPDRDVDFTMSPSNHPSLPSFLQLKYAVLSAYCYVQINLGEYVLALQHAQELNKYPDLPDAYKLLANLYCAESLIMMDRCDEAKIYLEPRFIATLKEDDFIRRASPDWDASSLNAAQAILEYNVLVLMVLKDEIDLAKSLIGRVKHPLLITHLKRLTIYLEMRSGNIERCRNLVGVDSPHL